MNGDYKDNYDYLKKRFREIFGGDASDLRIFNAPGRVNLIGEHIDYCGGYVLPAALTLGTTIVSGRRKDRMLRMAATDLADRVEVSLDDTVSAKGLKWGNYQAGVADELQKAGYRLTGADMLYHDTIPHGAGLSSSAAIEVATAFALASLGSGLSGGTAIVDRIGMALIAQKAENNFCGVSCGIMDQFSAAMGRKGHAILLDCSSLKYRYARLNLEGYRIVLGDTAKKRSLSESKYNERTREVAAGFAILKGFFPDRKNLCDITAEEYEEHKHRITDDTIRKRVEHVVYENRRVLESFDALEKNDMKKFGDLMAQAQYSISKLYEVTGTELDTMVDEALKINGVLASRMTGAGFGGCTVNVVRKENIEEFIGRVGENYTRRTGLVPLFHVCETGDGVREIVD